jgi:hypothetical protein
VQHNKKDERGKISSIPFSEENYWSFRRKKFKTTITGAQGIEILPKESSRCVNLNTE